MAFVMGMRKQAGIRYTAGGAGFACGADYNGLLFFGSFFWRNKRKNKKQKLIDKDCLHW
jgi:hypothetical protein